MQSKSCVFMMIVVWGYDGSLDALEYRGTEIAPYFVCSRTSYPTLEIAISRYEDLAPFDKNFGRRVVENAEGVAIFEKLEDVWVRKADYSAGEVFDDPTVL